MLLPDADEDAADLALMRERADEPTSSYEMFAHEMNLKPE